MMHAGQWPEHGSDYRGSRIHCDNAHAGELITTVVCPDPAREISRESTWYHVIRCAPCQLIHAWPLPDADILTAYYTEQFYTRSHPQYLARYEKDREWWVMTHHTILRQAMHAMMTPRGQADAWMSSVTRTWDPLTILDVGTGPGLALDTARSLGFATHGLELDPTMVTRGQHRGHDVMLYDLDTYHAQMTIHAALGTYDLVYAYEVLEHQANPEEFVLQCWDLLKLGGVLAVQVPNDFNPLQLLACQRHGLPYWWLQAPEHLTYFTPKTLQLLLRRCGFEVVYYRSTWPLEKAMLTPGGDEDRVYVGNDQLGRLVHEERMDVELALWKAGRWREVEERYTRQLLDCGAGRELVAIARKA